MGCPRFCVAFIAIQLVPLNRTNPPVQGDFRGSAEVVSVLRRACYDCHSNETVWPWYSRVAPLSWVIAHDVNEGRAALNFSTWNQLSAEKQAEAMNESWEEVQKARCPLGSTWHSTLKHDCRQPINQCCGNGPASATAKEEREGHDD